LSALSWKKSSNFGKPPIKKDRSVENKVSIIDLSIQQNEQTSTEQQAYAKLLNDLHLNQPSVLA
jgi:hypothetical protein